MEKTSNNIFEVGWPSVPSVISNHTVTSQNLFVCQKLKKSCTSTCVQQTHFYVAHSAVGVGGKSGLNPYLTRVLETMPHHKIGPQ